jgi:hypothetical protein
MMTSNGREMVSREDYLISGKELAEICEVSHKEMLRKLWELYGSGWKLFGEQIFPGGRPNEPPQSFVVGYCYLGKRATSEDVRDYYLNIEHFQIVACVLTPEQNTKAIILLCEKLSNFERDLRIDKETRRDRQDAAVRRLTTDNPEYMQHVYTSAKNALTDPMMLPHEAVRALERFERLTETKISKTGLRGY